jgi:hypothetical protein
MVMMTAVNYRVTNPYRLDTNNHMSACVNEIDRPTGSTVIDDNMSLRYLLHNKPLSSVPDPE